MSTIVLVEQQTG